MFLYELVLHLGIRSTDLVAKARELGLDVGPSSSLTHEQVQLLWSAVAPAPPEGAPTSAGPVAPPSGIEVGPATWGAPAAPAVAQPMAAPSPRPAGRRPSAIYLAVPVLLLLAAVLFVSTRDDDKSGDDEPNRSQAVLDMLENAEDAEETEYIPVLGGGDVYDQVAFCQAWEDMQLALIAVPRETREWADVRATKLASASVTLDHVDELKAVTGGTVRSDLIALEEITIETKDLYESLPDSEHELTRAEMDAMNELNVESRGVGDLTQNVARGC